MSGTQELLSDSPAKDVLRLRLNRPERLNAVNMPLVSALIEAFDGVDAGAVVLCSSTPRAFCAGADLDLEDGGDIAVRLERNGSVARLVVRDTGIGIPEEEQERIWARLYRGDKSRSQRGLGLGLSLVKAVVEAHQGNVRVSSRVEEGAEFTVTLPKDAPGKETPGMEAVSRDR